jgi:hypothetical protein
VCWRVEIPNEIVAIEIESLPEDIQARFVRVTRLIIDFGLEKVGAPHVKHLEGKLWEIRLKGHDRIARALYVTASEACRSSSRIH